MNAKAIACFLAVIFSAQCFSKTPSELVEQYFQDYQSQGIKGTVQHMHSVELNKLRELLLPYLDTKKTPQASELRRELFGEGVTYDTLAAYKTQEFVSTLFSHLGAAMDMDSLKLERFDVIGELKEGQDVHVLVRTKFSYKTATFDRLDIASTRLDDKQWRLLPPKDVTSLIDMVKSMLKNYSQS